MSAASSASSAPPEPLYSVGSIRGELEIGLDLRVIYKINGVVQIWRTATGSMDLSVLLGKPLTKGTFPLDPVGLIDRIGALGFALVPGITPQSLEKPIVHLSEEVEALKKSVLEKNDDFLCPVSRELMIKPVRIELCGHRLGKNSWQRLQPKVCPLCRRSANRVEEDMKLPEQIEKAKADLLPKIPELKQDFPKLGEAYLHLARLFSKRARLAYYNEDERRVQLELREKEVEARADGLKYHFDPDAYLEMALMGKQDKDQTLLLIYSLILRCVERQKLLNPSGVKMLVNALEHLAPPQCRDAALEILRFLHPKHESLPPEFVSGRGAFMRHLGIEVFPAAPFPEGGSPDSHIFSLIPGTYRDKNGNGKPYTANNLIALLKAKGIEVTLPKQDGIWERYGDVHEHTTHYVALLKRPFQRALDPQLQQRIKENAEQSGKDFRIPDLVEAITCMAMNYFQTGQRYDPNPIHVFSSEPDTDKGHLLIRQSDTGSLSITFESNDTYAGVALAYTPGLHRINP